MQDYLKITRKRSFHRYLLMIERLAMFQGNSEVIIGSLRWNRLQLCIDSIKHHLYMQFNPCLVF